MRVPFVKSPIEKLAQRLTEAEAEVNEKQADLDGLAAEGKELAAAANALNVAKEMLTARRKAHSDAIDEAKALKAKQDQDALKKVWNEDGDKLEGAGSVYVKDVGDLVSVLGRCVVSGAALREHVLFDGGLAELFAKLQVEIPVSIQMYLDQLKHHVTEVRAGRAALARSAPPQPVIAPPPVVPLFSLRPIAWTAHDGTVQTEHAWYDVSLPSVAAARALRLGAVCHVSDPRRAKHRGYGKTFTKPKPADCVNLDHDEAPDLRVVEPEVHSSFQRVDRGGPVTMKVPRGNPVPVSATRNLDGDKT